MALACTFVLMKFSAQNDPILIKCPLADIRVLPTLTYTMWYTVRLMFFFYDVDPLFGASSNRFVIAFFFLPVLVC